MESQVESKTIVSDSQGKGAKTAEQIQREHERRGLQLSRTRIKNDLDNATHPNHRKSLEAALAHLDKKIAELN